MLIKRLLWCSIFVLVLALLASCSQKSFVEVPGFIEGQFVYLSSSVSGHLQQLLVSRGDFVKPRQKLVVLDPMPEQEALHQAKMQLVAEQAKLSDLLQGQRATILNRIIAQQQQAEANYQLAQQTLTRYQYLYKVHVVGKAALDDAMANYEAALQRVNEVKAELSEARLGARYHQILMQQAQVAATQAQVKQMEWQLQQKVLLAPEFAQIYDTLHEKGEYIPAGQPILSLISPRNIQLVFYVPEPLLSNIQIGEIVYFDCDGCSQKTEAVVSYLSNKAEYTPPVIYSKDTRDKLMYRVEATISPKKALYFHPGQPVTVYLKIKNAR